MVKLISNTLISQIEREIITVKAELSTWLVSLILWAIIYPLMLLTLASKANEFGNIFGESAYTSSIIGFLLWRFSTAIITASVYHTVEESQHGTLELLILSSPLTVISLLVSRLLSITMLKMIEFVFYALILYFLFDTHLPMNRLTLMILSIVVIQTWALSLILSGLSLHTKNLYQTVSIFSTLTLFFSGAMVPLNALGSVFTYIKFLWPMAWPIDVMRQVIISKMTILELIRGGEMYGLIIQTTVFLVLAIIVVPLQYKKALRFGTLSAH